jgi:NhaP-type Na+/H+ or K+/H+ antiporter
MSRLVSYDREPQPDKSFKLNQPRNSALHNLEEPTMKHLITLLLFVGAIAAYIAGSTSGAAVLVVAGLALESVAWYRLLRGKKNRPVSTH